MRKGLNNSPFMALLGSVAWSNPDALKACFYNTEVNDAGIYLLYFYVNGVRTPVIVDDSVPVALDGQQPITMTVKENEYWPFLLEKAWAKLHGSYARIMGGSPTIPMIHLFAAPTCTIVHDTKDQIEELMQNKDHLFW